MKTFFKVVGVVFLLLIGAIAYLVTQGEGGYNTGVLNALNSKTNVTDLIGNVIEISTKKTNYESESEFVTINIVGEKSEAVLSGQVNPTGNFAEYEFLGEILVDDIAHDLDYIFNTATTYSVEADE